jgi:hemerythrin
MIVWNEDLATGSETIDGQHKMLILYINKLEEMLENTEPSPRDIRFAHSLVDFLEQYAATHFKYEEHCMECFRCSAGELNREQHAQFIEFFGRFHKKFQAEGFSVEAFQDLHRMTSAWITSHILQVDTQLMPFAGKS